MAKHPLVDQEKNWTAPQRHLMAKAGKYHAVRGLAVSLVIIVAAVTGWAIWGSFGEQRQATHAAGLVQRVLDAETAQVPSIVGDMAGYRRFVDPLLREENDRAATKSRRKLHARLALLPIDPRQVDFLYGHLLDAAPNEVPIIIDALAVHKDEIRDNLWAVVESPENGKESQRLRAAAALAKYDQESERWAKVQEAIANDLVRVPAVYLSLWIDSLRRIRGALAGAAGGGLSKHRTRGIGKNSGGEHLGRLCRRSNASICRSGHGRR